ncbi:MAG TPA: LysR substrate-binding domain-containing protein [Acetobacteraceae bacterium]|nr:LysR substrate-binding domain-containing protein [Acetobacteraceae bacterium]
MRRAPPLSAIEAFLAAAEAGSFRAAADALHLSAPAITRRIQALERHIGLRLFDRRAGGAALTAEGLDLRTRLAPAMTAVTEAVVQAPGQRRPVRLRISRSLAATWLAPRLRRYAADVALDLRAELTLDDLRDGAADLGIFFGACAAPDLVAEPLLPVELSVVSASRLADGRAAPSRLDDLRSYHLLALSNPPGLWHRLLPDPPEFLTFDSIQVMYEAATQGLGLAPGLSPLVNPYLANGRLVRPDMYRPAPVGAYYLVANRRALRSRDVVNVRQWLTAEAVRSSPP